MSNSLENTASSVALVLSKKDESQFGGSAQEVDSKSEKVHSKSLKEDNEAVQGTIDR